MPMIIQAAVTSSRTMPPSSKSMLIKPPFISVFVLALALAFASILSTSTSTAFSAASSSSSSTTTTTTTTASPFTIGNKQVPGLQYGMDYVQLSDSDLIVSKVCMGTMTYGEQNTVKEGVELLNCAFDTYGINFVDTAEIYPVPTKPTTQGRTDLTVREFLKGRNRSDVIVATKVAGRSSGLNWLPRDIPNTSSDLTKEQIIKSVNESLKRLDIDYIDLLQIHWPGRYTGGQFGSPDFSPSQYEQESSTNSNMGPPIPLEDKLEALQCLIKEGKVRYIGVSNETPYGVATMCQLAKQYPDLYPKIVSIQNSYSLVVRKDYEAGLAETCYHHNVALLPYSPLAGGTLSGKYRKQDDNNNDDDNNIGSGRLTLFPGFMERYLQSLNEEAVNAYCDLALRYKLTPTQLALSWCYHNELVTSTIIGATTMEQLHENIKAYDIQLNKYENGNDIMDGINDIYKQYTDPTKAKNNPQ